VAESDAPTREWGLVTTPDLRDGFRGGSFLFAVPNLGQPVKLGHDARVSSRRGWIIGVLVVVVLASACIHRQPSGPVAGPSMFGQPVSVVQTYHDPGGWSIEVPLGWQVVPFDTSAEGTTARGALISNVTLPSPSLAPGYPLQTNDRDLPADGIALVAAVDPHVPYPSHPPPLPAPLSLDDFTQGSALAGTPTLDSLTFTGDGKDFVATVKIGPNVHKVDLQSLRTAVASLRID
jgi:hypothetical protein